MLTVTKARTRLMMGLAFMALPALTFAQNYYDDDIYYNPSKQKKNETVKTTKTTTTTVRTVTYENYDGTVADYPAADTYYVNTGSTRDVDEYNRRGQFLVSDSTVTETETPDTYSNTRRIQRFHNEDIIETLGDDDYATYVITDPTTVNIYVDSWSSPYYYYPSYYNSWRWNWGLYSPYWSLSWSLYDPWYWGPSWGWNWGWGPGWGPSWAWGPSWGPGWGPGPAWGPGHGPGWGPGHGPSTAWRPTPSGSSRPHAYAGAGANVSGNRNNYRPVSSAAADRVTGNTSASRPGTTGRPGNSGYGHGAADASTTRPGSISAGNTGDRHMTPVNGGTVNGSNQGVTTTGRGRNNSGTTATPATRPSNSNSTTTRPSSTSTRQSSTTRSSSSSNGSYNRGSSSGSSHQSIGSGSGSRGGGGFGSGSRGGGGSSGGGGRGRR